MTDPFLDLRLAHPEGRSKNESYDPPMVFEKKMRRLLADAAHKVSPW